MVGGYAANLHGYHRFTGDIDIWLEDTDLNRQRLRAAFIECGMGDYFMLDRIQFVPGWTPKTCKVCSETSCPGDITACIHFHIFTFLMYPVTPYLHTLHHFGFVG